MFDSQDNMIKLDMSEFSEKHTVSRLVGAPPGYVGYDDGGQLTDTVRRKSYCLILLDELEKAHPDVYTLLLQIFDEGRLADAKGRKVDFRNTIIIMSGNVGSDLIKRDSRLGFGTAGGDDGKSEQERYDRMKDKVMAEVKNVFKPEFLNRIDSTVVFRSLSPQDIHKVVDLELVTVTKQLAAKGIMLEVTDGAKTWLGDKGYDHVFGARPLRRLIQDTLDDKLSEMLLGGEFGPGDTVMVDSKPADEGEGLNITTAPPAEEVQKEEPAAVG
jgi:ATP-dependent Clp protease ATP-binding subunit ClpC